MINVKKEPFNDPRVRKAIYLALDRQQINELVLDGTGVMPTIFMPGMAYTEEEAITWPGIRPKDTRGGQEDLALAKRLMAEAGFPDGFRTTFDSRSASLFEPICQVVKDQLQGALGIVGDFRTWDRRASFELYETARPEGAEGDWALACQGEAVAVRSRVAKREVKPVQPADTNGLFRRGLLIRILRVAQPPVHFVGQCPNARRVIRRVDLDPCKHLPALGVATAVPGG